jgi:hypothetical protein
MPISLRSRAVALAAALSLLGSAACGPQDEATASPAAQPTTAAASAAADAPVAASNGAPQLVVYKTPTCGCCKAWVDHMRENGFAVDTRDMDDLTPIKAQYGIASEHQSCHTAVVDGYVVEGHVPADLVAKLLTDRPADVAALVVPGMPMGSPGMEGVYKEAYEVLAVGKDGRSTVYARR